MSRYHYTYKVTFTKADGKNAMPGYYATPTADISGKPTGETDNNATTGNNASDANAGTNAGFELERERVPSREHEPDIEPDKKKAEKEQADKEQADKEQAAKDLLEQYRRTMELRQRSNKKGPKRDRGFEHDR